MQNIECDRLWLPIYIYILNLISKGDKSVSISVKHVNGTPQKN